MCQRRPQVGTPRAGWHIPMPAHRSQIQHSPRLGNFSQNPNALLVGPIRLLAAKPRIQCRSSYAQRFDQCSNWQAEVFTQRLNLCGPGGDARGRVSNDLWKLIFVKTKPVRRSELLVVSYDNAPPGSARLLDETEASRRPYWLVPTIAACQRHKSTIGCRGP